MEPGLRVCLRRSRRRTRTATRTRTSHEDEDGNELHAREVVARDFLVSGRDCTEALDAMDEQLDMVPDAVELAIQPALALARGIAVDDRLHAFRTHSSHDSIGVISSVCDERTTSRVCNQLLRHHRVVHVPGGQRNVERPPLGIHKGGELR